MSPYNVWWTWLRYRVLWRVVLNQSGYSLSSSQTGEDMIIRSVLGSVSRGFYVDIGAYHPVGISNTYHFYLRGWRGLNVDANPLAKRLFDWVRPRDINVQACVDVEGGVEKDYYMFDRPALNTITPAGVKAGIEEHGTRPVKSIRLRTRTLNDLLDEYVAPAQPIHLLSIDVEGLDHALLTSLNFDKYRPWVLCFEDKAAHQSGLVKTETMRFLEGRGYVVVGVTPLSVIMKRGDL
jgi:hypothetical protein